MQRILATPRRAVGPDVAYELAAKVAVDLRISVLNHSFSNKSGQITILVDDHDAALLKRYTQTLRVDHKSTFTYVSGATGA